MIFALRVPGGNLVDGLPPARHRAGVFPMESNTKTIAKRARVGPRTQVHMTMKKLCWTRIPSTCGLGSDMIVLDNVWKLWIELIR